MVYRTRFPPCQDQTYIQKLFLNDYNNKNGNDSIYSADQCRPFLEDIFEDMIADLGYITQNIGQQQQPITIS